MTSKTNMHLTNFFFNILNISMHPYLKFNYDFLGLKSLLDNLGFLRGSQTLTSSSSGRILQSHQGRITQTYFCMQILAYADIGVYF